MRAPAISSCAEKIFFVDCVERMRRRSARREPAMGQAFFLTWTRSWPRSDASMASASGSLTLSDSPSPVVNWP
jgi:hypothetical protein